MSDSSVADYLGNVEASSIPSSPTQQPPTKPRAKRFSIRPGQVIEETTGTAITVVSFEKTPDLVQRPSDQPSNLQERPSTEQPQQAQSQVEPASVVPQTASTPSQSASASASGTLSSEPSLAPDQSTQVPSTIEPEPEGFSNVNSSSTLSPSPEPENETTAASTTSEQTLSQAAEVELQPEPERSTAVNTNLFDSSDSNDNRLDLIGMSDVLIEEPQPQKYGTVELRISTGGLFNRKKYATRYLHLQGTMLTFSKKEGTSPNLRAKLGKGCTVDVSGLEFILSTPQRQYTCRFASNAEALEWAAAIRDACRRRSKRYRDRKVHEMVVHKELGVPLGISIAGGVDSGVADKTDVYVTGIKPEGAVAKQGVLERGDVLMEIDGHSLQGITHEAATQLLRQASGEINLKVLRKARRALSSDSVTTTPAETAAPSPLPPSSPKPASSPAGTASVAKSLAPLAEDQSAVPEPSTAPPAAPSTGAAAATDDEAAAISRAERLKRMSEKRKAKRQSQQEDILSVLQLIDDLPEE
eukprot:m.86017 g.86017  ORF g.86017 m.86017 type:complete len:527 (-) comp14759_c0_seq1:1802-3382(-)